MSMIYSVLSEAAYYSMRVKQFYAVPCHLRSGLEWLLFGWRIDDDVPLPGEPDLSEPA